MKTYRTETHRLKLAIDCRAGGGGEGEVYRAHNTDTGEIMAVKMFAARFKNADTLKRIRYLASLNLQSKNPVLFGPIDTIVIGALGHVSRWAEGESLEELLKNPPFTLEESIVLCQGLADAFSVLHELDMAHGDPQALNLKAHKNHGTLQVALFDFDNYRSPAVPLPQMLGQHLYMAPELRRTPGALPDRTSDNFALAVIFHEFLLLRHPASGFDDTEDKFVRAMSSGLWMQDRSRNQKDMSTLGGYPVAILNPTIENLFRRGLSRDRTFRPTPKEWKTALSSAQASVRTCSKCCVQFIVDSSKLECPACRQPFPNLRLAFNGTVIPLAGSVVVGRSELGSPKVSAQHVFFHKIGPDTWITAVGRNPTFRFGGSHWIQLPNNKKLLIAKGDRLRLADTEVRIV